MSDHLTEFIENVERAEDDEFHERVLRYTLEALARNGPLPALVYLGRSLVEFRKSQVRTQAQRN